jgi:hypothetical protein
LESGLPRFRPDFSCPTLLRNTLEQKPIFIDGAITLYGRAFQLSLTNRCFFRIEVLQPLFPKEEVWAGPGSLAATTGVSIDFFYPGYLDVSVPLVTASFEATRHYSCKVSPFGDLRVKACLAARRSLSQLTASFIGILSQGIHSLLFFQCHNVIFPFLLWQSERITKIFEKNYLLILILKTNSDVSFEFSRNKRSVCLHTLQKLKRSLERHFALESQE